MDHQCSQCHRYYKQRSRQGEQLVCPYCNHPEGKQPKSVTRAENNRYRELVDNKSRAAGERGDI